MKKLSALILCFVMALAFAGCSLFSGEETEAAKTTGDLKISDTFTHKDPTDIEFTDRYTLYSGSNQALLDAYKEEGYNVAAEYFILYGDKNDVPIRNYTYYVFETAEDAQGFFDELKQYSDEADEEFNLEIQDDIVIEVNDQEKLKNMIDSYILMGVMEEDTASYYAKQNKVQFDELMDYTGE